MENNLIMLLTIEKQNNAQSLDKLQFTNNDRCVLHFSEDGKEWISYSMSGEILRIILKKDKLARDKARDPDVYYKPLNGNSFLVGPEDEAAKSEE